MRLKKLLLILALVLPFAMVTATGLAKRSTISEDLVIWELTQIQVMSEGQPVDLREGLFTTEYTIEARAHAKNSDLIPNGVFRLTFSAFSPFEQMDAQKAGYWYIQGTWSITRDNPNLEAMQAKHNSEIIEGTVIAEVPFNPTESLNNWTALARLTMSLVGDGWADGEGTLTFNQDNTGSLFLDLTRWPNIQLETTR